MVGVTGSNPVPPTNSVTKGPAQAGPFCFPAAEFWVGAEAARIDLSSLVPNYYGHHAASDRVLNPRWPARTAGLACDMDTTRAHR